MTKNNEKQFDCLKMKNDIQAQVYAETQNMSTAELLSYFNREYKGPAAHWCVHPMIKTPTGEAAFFR